MFGTLDSTINRVFAAKDITNKQGKVVGVSIGMLARKDIATAHGLTTGKTNKDQLDGLQLKAQDGMLNMVKSRVAGLNGEWTAKAARVWTDKNGDMNMSFRLKTVKRSMSDEKLANGLFPTDKYPAMKLEDKLAAVAMMRQSQEAQLAGKTLDIASDKTAEELAFETALAEEQAAATENASVAKALD